MRKSLPINLKPNFSVVFKLTSANVQFKVKAEFGRIRCRFGFFSAQELIVFGWVGSWLEKGKIKLTKLGRLVGRSVFLSFVRSFNIIVCAFSLFVHLTLLSVRPLCLSIWLHRLCAPFVNSFDFIVCAPPLFIRLISLSVCSKQNSPG